MKRLGTIGMITALVWITGSWAANGATTRVNNVNDPINHPYSQSGTNYGCTANNRCEIDFPAANSETLIQHVSCSYFLATNVVTEGAFVANNTTGDVNYLPVST